MGTIFPAIALTLIAFVSPGSSANSTDLCMKNSDCSGGRVCVPHHNYTSGSSCQTQSYCINVGGQTCSCRDGYTCRQKDCPKSPFECIILENHDTRCGGERAPVCKEGEVCVYVFQNIYCYECPCYHTHEVSCVKITKQHRACGPNAIAEMGAHRKYSCDGCRSATAVLTPPTFSPGP